MVVDLAWEGCAIQRLDEVWVDLVGSDNDSCHGLLVLRSGGGQQGESCQRYVVLTAGQTALVIAVRAQAASRSRKKKQRWMLGIFLYTVCTQRFLTWSLQPMSGSWSCFDWVAATWVDNVVHLLQLGEASTLPCNTECRKKRVLNMGGWIDGRI